VVYFFYLSFCLGFGRDQEQNFESRTKLVDYAKILLNLKRKNALSLTPLKLLLNVLILALKLSAEAFVLLLLK